jgi:hypothetical protein
MGSIVMSKETDEIVKVVGIESPVFELFELF